MILKEARRMDKERIDKERKSSSSSLLANKTRPGLSQGKARSLLFVRYTFWF